MVTFCVGVMTSPTPSVSGTADQLPSSDHSPSSDHKSLTGHSSKASSPCSNPSPASSSLSTPAVSSLSTPQAPPNTTIAEFLVYPTPIRETKLEATSRSACVLTSAESHLLLKQKEQRWKKKRLEGKANERRKEWLEKKKRRRSWRRAKPRKQSKPRRSLKSRTRPKEKEILLSIWCLLYLVTRGSYMESSLDL